MFIYSLYFSLLPLHLFFLPFLSPSTVKTWLRAIGRLRSSSQRLAFHKFRGQRKGIQIPCPLFPPQGKDGASKRTKRHYRAGRKRRRTSVGGTEYKAAYTLTPSVEVAIHRGKEQEAIRRNKIMAEYGWGRGFPAMF